MENLSGKTALVTGSTNGVRLVARELGQAGARVLVHGRDAERGAPKQEMAQAPPCSISLCRSCAVWLSEIPAFLLVIAARGSAQIRQSATPKYGVSLHAALARFVVAVAHYCSIFHGSLLLSNFLASVTHLTLLGRSRTLLWLGVQQAAR